MNQTARTPAAAQRNCQPIIDAIAPYLPSQGSVLEIASGSGYHAAHFAKEFSSIRWQPSDLDTQNRISIQAWKENEDIDNLLSPIEIDASTMPIDLTYEGAICINMIHISPWEATLGLFSGLSQILDSGAPLILYGPFLFSDSSRNTPGNIDFDLDLKNRNSQWGVRVLEEVIQVAESNSFFQEATIAMPSNNLTAVFRKT